MESKSMKRQSLKSEKNSKYKGIALIILATLFTAAGLTSFKFMSKSLAFSPDVFFNFFFIFGLILYFGGAVLLIISLKFDELSKLYPFISLSYVWTVASAILFFGEQTNSYKIAGCILIIIGVSILGGKND
jgi:drug/metabolite transporter (DMT)-like permease